METVEPKVETPNLSTAPNQISPKVEPTVEPNVEPTVETVETAVPERSSLASKAVELNEVGALRFLLEHGADVNVL